MKLAWVRLVFCICAAILLGLPAFAQGITIFPTPPPGPPVPLSDGVITVPYFNSLSTSGSDPSTVWTITGALPPGLTTTPSGTFLNISGTPTALGTYTFTAKAVDAAAGPGSQKCASSKSRKTGPANRRTRGTPGRREVASEGPRDRGHGG